MKDCIVLGSGRSGTSMVAGCLHGANYFMGDDLMPPTAGNPKGIFESYTVERINEELLMAVAPRRPRGLLQYLFPGRLGPSQRWLARVPVGTSLPTRAELAAAQRRLTSRRPFCFKDPRFCYTLPCWRPALGDAAFVCVFRHPTATVRSILRECRDEDYLHDLSMDEARAYDVWSLMHRHILEVHVREGDWLFLHFDQVISGDGLDRLEHFVETPVDRSFPDQNLTRSAAGDAPDDVMALYRELCERAFFDQES